MGKFSQFAAQPRTREGPEPAHGTHQPKELLGLGPGEERHQILPDFLRYW